MNPIASAEESLPAMWVGDSPSYSVPFDSSRERKIPYWQNGFSADRGSFPQRIHRFREFRPFLHRPEKSNPGFAPGIYPMQGIRTLRYFLQYSICAFL